MTVKSRVRALAARGLSSVWLRRLKRSVADLKARLVGESPTLEVFVAVNDPYSYLLLQALSELRTGYSISLRFHIVNPYQKDTFPEFEAWLHNAVDDANALATRGDWDFPSVDNLAFLNEHNRVRDFMASALATLDDREQCNPVAALLTEFHSFWHGEGARLRSAVKVDTRVNAGNQLLAKLGHYQPGMVYYRSEWYWAVDRMDHLQQRLDQQGLRTGCRQYAPNQTRKLPSLTAKSDGFSATLEMFYSARSPYSYLGLEQAVVWCRDNGVELVVRPVLPMVMRGLPVPDNKKMYIFLDTKREAERLGIPYGYVSDPVGKGVERCYALLDFAGAQGKKVAFLLAFGRAVNSQGIDAASDSGMKRIVEMSGLDWQSAKGYLNKQDWRQWAKANQKELQEAGLWGVPCFRYGNLMVWGQDRLWLIAESIKTDSKQRLLSSN